MSILALASETNEVRWESERFDGNSMESKNEIASVFAPAGLGTCKFNTSEVLYVSY